MIIKNSHFVITGGNRGIGWAVAEMAAENQAHVYIASRSLESEKIEQLKKRGAGSVHFLKCDLSTKQGTEDLAHQLQSVPVDILFNNAGLLTGGLIEEQELSDIYSMFQVNLLSLVHLTKRVIPGMIERKRGKIINNSSVSAYMHFPCASTYAASKAAVAAFTNCLNAELSGTGVTSLSLITPGIKTRMFDEIEVKYGKNFEVPTSSITAEEYAQHIRKAIERDQSLLSPSGVTGVGLWISQHMSPLFRAVVQSRFKR